MTSNSNTVQYCYLCDEGAAFTLYQTTFKDTDSIYSYNSALTGGVFSLSQTTATLDTITVTNSYAVNGGVINLYNNNPLSVKSSKFTTSVAILNGGFAQFTNPSFNTIKFEVSITNSYFNSISSGKNGGAMYISNENLN